MIKENPRPHARNLLDKQIKEYMPERQDIYLIDFGLAKHYLSENSEHVPERKVKHFVGTAGFSSLNSHMLKE